MKETLTLNTKSLCPHFFRGVFLLVLLLGWFGSGHVGESVKVTADSDKGWVVNKAGLYSPQNFPPLLVKLLSAHNPPPILENTRTVTWVPERAYVLRVNDVAFYSVGYKPRPDLDIESRGLLLITRNAEIVYRESSSNIAPAYTNNPIPPLSLVKNKNREFIFLRAYEGLSQKSFLRIISRNSEKISELVTPGRGEFRIDDLDGDGSLEIFGYGIAVNGGTVTQQNADREKSATRPDISASKRIVFSARLGTGTTGKFQIFTLSEAGVPIPLAGGASRNFYENEAMSLLPYIKKLASQNDKQKLTGAVVAYLGIIEGTRDNKSTLELYEQLPNEVRASVDPVAIAKYWKEQGYPFLAEVFK